MIRFRFAIALVFLCASHLGLAFDWASSYDLGLKAAGQSHWSEARNQFLAAKQDRAEDKASPTNIPGPPTEARRWRDGSPYSPNFLAAYCGYRQALLISNLDAQTALLQKVASEFEALLKKQQVSRESVFFLTNIYMRLGDANSQQRIQQKFAKDAAMRTWRVDTTIVAPEELAVISDSFAGFQGGNASSATDQIAGQANFVAPTPGSSSPGIPTRVPIIRTKYALVIGNRSSQTALGVPYAEGDCQRVAAGIVDFAGYPAENVDLLIDGSAADIAAHADAMANRIPIGATVLIYFTGVAINLNGHDYLAGTDISDLSDRSKLLPKLDLFAKFLPKSAHLFAFFQVNRPGNVTTAFGSEPPEVGAISQMEATTAGDSIYSTYRNGLQIGLYSDSFVQALSELQSNRIPIMEFGWQVFFHMRRGDSGLAGGSSQQTCTLPLLNHLAADARF